MQGTEPSNTQLDQITIIPGTAHFKQLLLNPATPSEQNVISVGWNYRETGL